MPNWLKTSLKIVAALVVLVLVVLVSATLYITYNKDKVLKMVNTQLNKSIDGTLVIGNMKPNFFKGFPDVSLTLENVVVRDKEFQRHKHTLLDAKNFSVSVNTAALLKGTIDINHIDINDAAIDLFTDTSGYSNTSAFKKGNNKDSKDKSSGSSSSTELKNFSLSNVNFTLNDQKAHKLFNFAVNDIKGKMEYPDSGWRAKFHLDVMAKSMAFNSLNGSFIKNKQLKGDFVAGFNEKSGKVNVNVSPLNIGGDDFKINAVFETANNPSMFSINIVADQILWRNASNLLAANITKVLNQFNISKPMVVTCNINGSFSGDDGGPKLYVTAKIKDSKITIPGAQLDSCSFTGIYSNNYVKDKGYGDDNSIIKLIGLKGTYNHLPFTIDTGNIINLIKPIATGNFKSSFPAADLNYFLEDDVAKFSNGWADMNLRYTADIVDYQINKPKISGSINLKNTDIHYVPRNINLKNNSISLNFIGDDLVLNNIRIQGSKSIITMEGRINNFLNLYYNSPEKILLTWKIRSPQLYLGEFLGFLSERKATPAKKSSGNSGNIVKQLGVALDKGKADIHMQVAKVYYKKFLATDVNADMLTTDGGIIIKNIGLKHSGGSLNINGKLMQGKSLNNFAINSTVVNVNMRDFFYAFNNFGLQDFTYENLQGFLSAKTKINGGITDAGNLSPRSINGSLDLSLRNAALINFSPLVSVGRFAFPFRSLKNIKIPKLDGHFDILGDKITIRPLKISSSVLNVDVAGVYGLTNGTDIALDIPLRNPGKDSLITDKDELAKKRYRGIVLHIRAHEENGKMKIGWNKNHK